MTNRTQKKWVKNILLKEGEISRNFALSQYVSRLGSYICLLKKEGMQIEATKRGTDYVYTLINRPPRTIYTIDRERGVAVAKVL